MKWLWWTLAGIGTAAVVTGIVRAVRSNPLGQTEYTNTYKGFTISTTCGALGPGCWAGWKVSIGGTTFSESAGGNTFNPAQALAAAQARIDSYAEQQPPVVPA
jgi:hypothetical protein